MKNILALFTDRNHSVLPAVLNIARAGSFELQGVYLNYTNSSVDFKYPFFNDLSLAQPRVDEGETGQLDTQLAKHSMQLIKDECKEAGIPFRFTVYEHPSLDQLIAQTASADLLVLDANLYSEEDLPKPLIGSLKDILLNAHCPVFVLTQQEAAVEKIILAYDGSASSLHAIEMYSDLLPEWTNVPTILVCVQPSGSNHVPTEQDVNNWLPKRFANHTIKILHGEVKEELVHFIRQQIEHVAVVMGASGRDELSRLFHKSLSSVILKQTTASLFTTHG